MGVQRLSQKMQDIAVKLLRILQEGEVADVGLDEKAGVRRPVRHLARLVVGDHLVVVGIDDPGGDFDLREIGASSNAAALFHILVICARKALYSFGVGDSAAYSRPARGMYSLTTGLCDASATPRRIDVGGKGEQLAQRSG